MNQSNNVHETLNAVATMLLWCFGLGMGVLAFWFGILVLMGDLVYSIHSEFFHISREQFEAIHYLALTLTKVAVFALFLFPYVGLRFALKKGQA